MSETLVVKSALYREVEAFLADFGDERYTTNLPAALVARIRLLREALSHPTVYVRCEVHDDGPTTKTKPYNAKELSSLWRRWMWPIERRLAETIRERDRMIRELLGHLDLEQCCRRETRDAAGALVSLLGTPDT